LNIPYLTPEAGGAPRDVTPRGLADCSGNFGLSPDGKWLAVSCADAQGGPHSVYLVLPDGTGTPRKVTRDGRPSFFHAWSPDGGTIAFTRGSAGKADIFTVAAAGGTEKRLTHDALNDGPDFSPDGKLIYFDSARSGTSQIWRMQADGSAAEQITGDDSLNTSPHVSPDGKSIAFLSQPQGAGDDIGPAALKIMAFGDGLIRTLTDFQGSRNSFSMYGWGDNNHVAFISYQSPTQRNSDNP
jgi:Tol biopolymer transport system component